MLSVAGGILIAVLALFIGWLGLTALGMGNKSGGVMLLCIAAVIVGCVLL